MYSNDLASQESLTKPANFKRLNHTELVKFIACEPRNEFAWKEFYDRFHEHICLSIYRACQRKRPADGSFAVEDLAQEVYKKLLKDNCQALRVFQGRWENSMFEYLRIIATRVVINHFQKAHQVITSLDRKVRISPGDREVEFIETLEIEAGDEQIRRDELREEIQFCLDKILKGKRYKERDLLIFKQYLYEDLAPEKIAALPAFNLSAKTVWNIISNIKEELRKCLQLQQTK